MGVVPVPDRRLDRLAALFKPKKTTPTTLEFVDIAGLVAGASKGEGLGNQFLGNIRQVDAIAHVLRCFEDPDVVHVAGKVDPRGDQRRGRDRAHAEGPRLGREAPRADPEERQGAGQAGRAREGRARRPRPGEGRARGGHARPRAEALRRRPRARSRDLFLLTSKPVLYIANVDESQLGKEATDPAIQAVKALAEAEGAGMVEISGKVESELAALAPSGARRVPRIAGLEEPGLDRLVHAGYRLLGLITYFTSGEEECRAWTIHKGSHAPQAAGVIHSDFEKGFIKAEVIRIEDCSS